MAVSKAGGVSSTATSPSVTPWKLSTSVKAYTSHMIYKLWIVYRSMLYTYLHVTPSCLRTMTSPHSSLCNSLKGCCLSAWQQTATNYCSVSKGFPFETVRLCESPFKHQSSFLMTQLKCKERVSGA